MSEMEQENFLVDDMYTKLSDVMTEIHLRKDDTALHAKSAELFQALPEIFSDAPKAIIFRNIATPNFELKLAKEYADMLKLDLVVIEYTADKFCTRNRDKLHLGKMMFFSNKDKTQIIGKENVIDIKNDDNKQFCDILTTGGEELISFHHRIFKQSGFENVKTFDASIYKKAGMTPHQVYLKILSICACNAVLLENFLIKADKGEKRFTEEVIVPAFLEIKKMLGKKPLITPLLGVDGEGSICWQHYNQDVQKCLSV